jgi:hypothetical protein
MQTHNSQAIMKYFLICLLFFVLGFASVIVYKKYTVAKQTTSIKTPLSKSIPFSLDTPPKQSLQGEIISFTPDIDWQSRSATKPAKLQQKIPVLQGEEFWTKETGMLEILFPSTYQISLQPKSHLNFIQTIPTNFVMLENSGKIIYKKLNPTTPTGIRVLHLLVQQESGEIAISVDDERPIVSITVLKGVVTAAFNDAKNISTVLTINEGSTYIFNDQKREGEITTTE